MSDLHPLKKIVKEQKEGIARGICSVCSANPYVLRATMEKGKEDNSQILIESTCNQVNQFGGYTGRTPQEFKEYVETMADSIGFPREKIILGGDHLGPNTWQDETSEQALTKAEEMVRQYVKAGYTKIHLDASMRLADDDKTKALSPEIIADRGARLCNAAEEAYQELKGTNPDAMQPVYVIGTEVPTPGGMQDEEEELQLTSVSDFKKTVELSKKAFEKYSLTTAWKNVVAVVVQPGVEFGNNKVVEYDSQAAQQLVQTLEEYDNLVFEGHSTDYQVPEFLKEMVKDNIAILKVGPALTFAVREALFALAMIEEELLKYENEIVLSNFIDVLDIAMIENNKNWRKHYHGKEKKVRLDRKYSLSDRSRYYYSVPEVEEALAKLMSNLKSVEIPFSLINQYLPVQYKKLRRGLIDNDPEAMVVDKVVNVLDEYSFAINP